MIICATALLFHVMALHGVKWKGAGAAWMLAALMDSVIICFVAYCIWGKP